MATKQLRLTVWKPLTIGKRIARGGSTHEWPLLDAENLFVETYVWQIDIDIWGSLSEGATSLRDDLISGFDPFLPPHDRTFDKLEGLLTKFGLAIADGETSWRECEQIIPPATENEEEVQFRANTIQVIYQHLKWVHQVFNTVPHANLTIR